MPRENNNKIMSATKAILHTRTGVYTFGIKSAATFIARFRGLMLSRALQSDQGLLITSCASVHTCLMRYAIDVVYLDKTGRVLKCVPDLKPWRTSFGITGKDKGNGSKIRTAHTLELAAGTIERLDIRPGDRLEHPLPPEAAHHRKPAAHNLSGDSKQLSEPGVHEAGKKANEQAFPRIRVRQHGSAMIEFAVVGPIITLLGMAILQYGMLFFAKNQINHASFMAARAGSTGNADLTRIKNAYIKALIPMYGGGRTSAELDTAECKARDAVEGRQPSLCLTEDEFSEPPPGIRIEVLNPTHESFVDWNDPALQAAVGAGRRVIPNSGLAFKDPSIIQASSGQSIQDANLIKLRITSAYSPKVPLMRTIYNKYLQWWDAGTDDFHSKIVKSGRIPIVTNVTLQMQSDAIEPDNPVSLPGMGNSGNPANPGDPLIASTPSPNCLTIGCTVESKPVPQVDPGAGSDGGCKGGSCPVPICEGAV